MSVKIQANFENFFPISSESSQGVHNHFVQFWEDTDYLVASVSHFIASGLIAGEGAIVIAKKDHLEKIEASLVERGINVGPFLSKRQLTLLDADETLAKIMQGDSPDPENFQTTVESLVKVVGERFGRIRAYGEMVQILWEGKNPGGMIQLEGLWNELGKKHHFALLCGYALKTFHSHEEREIVQHICDSHSHTLPSQNSHLIQNENERNRSLIVLEQQAHALKSELKKREQAESELNDFFENASIGLHLVSGNGIILRANQAELSLLGYSQEEYIGRHIADFHADEATITDILTRLSQRETLQSYPARLRAKDGSIIHVEIDSNALWKDGKFIHTRCFTKNVTEKVKAKEAAREALEFQKVIVDSSNDCIKVLDLNGRLLFMNERGVETLEVGDPFAIIGTDWVSLWEGDERFRAKQVIEKAKAGGSDEFIGFFPTLKSKQPKWWHVVASPIRNENNEVTKILVISRDFTEVKRAQENLQKALETRDTFLSIASHELKTPLTCIALQNEIRKRRYDPKSPEGKLIASLFNGDEKQINRLNRLVDDMLDISRIRTGKLSFDSSRFHLSEFVNTLVNRYRPQFDSEGYECVVNVEKDIHIEADLFRIDQAFTNLMINAMKYGLKKPIEITLKQEKSMAIFSVRDQGIGIKEEDRRRIFEKFERAPSSHNVSGLGLGLYITKQIVEGHAGEISVESKENEGSLFTIALPIKA
jgi:PAS domain S-box-containing protein